MNPSTRQADVVVVGAGIFGVCAAEALARSGAKVTLLDPGPVPHPRASSTDISKAIRSDYGDDRLYTQWAVQAIEGWRRWNEESGQTLFHEVGFLAWTPGPLEASPFEFESRRLHLELGISVEHWSSGEISRRMPGWSAADAGEAHFNPSAGWAASARAVEWRLSIARQAGVSFRSGFRAARLIQNGDRVVGVESTEGDRVAADLTVVAAGAWTPGLVPELADRLRPSAQTVFHFDGSHLPGLRELPVWCADISRTGWYGFPMDADGRFKLGHHGTGRDLPPDPGPDPDPGDEARFREFLSGRFPAMAKARPLASRICFYCDSFDGDFWIDLDPTRRGLLVAAGGSGHGFKFGPLVGGLVADLAAGRRAPIGARFRWRAKGPENREKARSKT